MFQDRDETTEAVRSGVARLCMEFPGEYWRALDEKRAYPKAFVDALTEQGYLASLIPEVYGGAGLDLATACVILETIHRSGGNAGAAHAQMYTMGTLLRHGSEAQKQRYLPGIAEGSLRLQAFGVTEPSSGTDTTRIKTTAVREGDFYRINGQKIWTSRAEYSDLMILLARTTPRSDCAKPSDGMSVFIVDMRENLGKSITINKIDTMINHSTTAVFFDDLMVSADNLIGQEGKGFRYILGGMNAERILIASECIGDARFFVDRATTYAREREVFGRPIGQNQGIQFPLAQAHMQTEAAMLMVERAASLYDQGQVRGSEANMAKYLAAEASWFAADTAMQTFGGFAFAAEYDIERKFREARLYRTAPISTNLIFSHVATHDLGLPKSF